jgi:hypothetical protein
VVQVQNARGANGSPLVVGLRNLADSEFWDFFAIDGSDKDPTTGFMPVSTRDGLLNAMSQINQGAQINLSDPRCLGGCKAAWGSVIKIIDTGNPIDLVDNNGGFHILVLPTGVTVRGDRRGTNLGPQLRGLYKLSGPIPHMFDIQGDYVRITGLRLQGPTTSIDAFFPSSDAIMVPPNGTPNDWVGVLIDHNDLSAWTNAAVEVYGPMGGPMKGGIGQVACPPPDVSRNDHVRIERNFIHHNDEFTDGSPGLGYGNAMSNGGAATIAGNTFLMNRHSIAGDADIREQYAAWFNLVMSRVPEHGFFGTTDQIFDMHGAFDGYGGFAGNEVDIAWNTFLPGNADDFWLRGAPCRVLDSFHNNVSIRNSDNAIKVPDPSGVLGPPMQYVSASTASLQIQNNQFADSSPSYSDPTVRLGVGDFDGDGVEDLFLATGAAWYYSPAGKAEWRYLNGGKTDRIDSLLLGDFDGDGRTDVLSLRGGQLVVSWGGISDWEVLNPNRPANCAITDMAVGDFDGDGHADIFCADWQNQTWWVSYGGNTPFVVVNSSSFQRKDLLFGDFDGDGKTDVFGVVFDTQHNVNSWSYSRSATGAWADGYLRPALTNTVAGLVVGDFAGTGRGVSVAMSCDSFLTPGCWQVSAGGIQNWHPYTLGSGPVVLAAVGHFLGRFDAYQNPLPVDLLFWNDAQPVPLVTIAMCDSSVGVNTEFCLSVGGIFPSYRYTSQDMR